MASDPGLADLLREDLAQAGPVAEPRMFGTLCFMIHGNIVCGAMDDGGLFRVGRAAEDAARALPGVRPMAPKGRPMAGFVTAGRETMADDDLCGRLLGLALAFAATLPPK